MPQVGGFDVAEISTHTPHARCDLNPVEFTQMSKNISTHTPHARCDQFTVGKG